MATVRKVTAAEAERLALGLDDPTPRRERRPWEAWELGYLEAFYGQEPVPTIAANLDNRTPLAVKACARKRGLCGRYPRGANRMRASAAGQGRTAPADDLAAPRDAYARLEAREQQARAQVARLVAELDQLKARGPMSPPAPAPARAPAPITDAALRAEIERLWIFLAVTLHMVGATKAAKRLGVSQAALHRAMTRAGVAGAALVEPDLAAKGGAS